MVELQAGNLFDNLPESLDGELVTILASGRQVRLERIVSTGQTSPEGFWYDQDEEEWVVLLTGGATLCFEEGESRQLRPGDHLLIPAHCRHRVEWTSLDEPTVWLALFFTSADRADCD